MNIYKTPKHSGAEPFLNHWDKLFLGASNSVYDFMYTILLFTLYNIIRKICQALSSHPVLQLHIIGLMCKC